MPKAVNCIQAKIKTAERWGYDEIHPFRVKNFLWNAIVVKVLKEVVLLASYEFLTVRYFLDNFSSTLGVFVCTF